jgi:hypothetical protein
MTSNKMVRIAIPSIIGVVVIIIILMWIQGKKSEEQWKAQDSNRYYDRSAVLEAKMETTGLFILNAKITGTVQNTTWKMRDMAVWAGMIKNDGFHEGSATGRNYYGFQILSRVMPGEKRNFSVECGVPPLNRNWSVIIEYDPGEKRIRPMWVSK